MARMLEEETTQLAPFECVGYTVTYMIISSYSCSYQNILKAIRNPTHPSSDTPEKGYCTYQASLAQKVLADGLNTSVKIEALHFHWDKRHPLSIGSERIEALTGTS